MYTTGYTKKLYLFERKSFNFETDCEPTLNLSFILDKGGATCKT